jgi:hypothetical protein
MRARTVTSRNIARSGADERHPLDKQEWIFHTPGRQASQPQTGEADETPPNRIDRLS